MSRRKATISVSLFPFLAVLLCAMGALILLLLIMARQIRETAVAAKRASPRPAAEAPVEPAAVPVVTVTIHEPPIPPPPDPNVELRRRLSVASGRHDELLREVERLRLAVAQRLDVAKAVEGRSASAAFDLDAARERLAAREAELRDREAERQKLLAEIRRAEGTLARVRQAAEAAEPKVSIVPYDGRSGTARRPILIECRGETIRFVPEDVGLSAADLAGFRPDYNPLLAGATALQAYWQNVDGSASPRPYVLLLVHEDGVAAYYAARALLRQAGNETGYELVTDDLNLAAPKLDPAAQAACRSAVLEALKLRSEVMTELARRERDNPLLRDDPFDFDRFDGGSPFGGRPTRPGSEVGVTGRGVSGPGGSPPAFVGDPTLPPEQPLGETAGDFAPSPPVVTADAVEPSAPQPWASPSLRSPAGDVARGVSRSRAATAASRSGPTPTPEDALADEFPDFRGPAAGKKRWGLSAPSANISLERPVRVVVNADSITVGSQPPIPITGTVSQETVGAVLDAVDREAASWGRSPGQFYWSPRLRAVVRPGGTGHYDRLRRLLNGTGLPGGDRIELPSPEPAFVELRYAQAAP